MSPDQSIAISGPFTSTYGMVPWTNRVAGTLFCVPIQACQLPPNPAAVAAAWQAASICATPPRVPGKVWLVAKTRRFVRGPPVEELADTLDDWLVELPDAEDALCEEPCAVDPEVAPPAPFADPLQPSIDVVTKSNPHTEGRCRRIDDT